MINVAADPDTLTAVAAGAAYDNSWFPSPAGGNTLVTAEPASGNHPSIGVSAMPEAATPEVSSPETATAQTQPRALSLTLNSDGRRHPLLNGVAILVLACGVCAFALGLYHSQHFLPSVLGIAAFGVGLVAQMMSATREQRILIVAGLVAGFVGMGLGIAHGGFG